MYLENRNTGLTSWKVKACDLVMKAHSCHYMDELYGLNLFSIRKKGIMGPDICVHMKRHQLMNHFSPTCSVKLRVDHLETLFLQETVHDSM